MGDYLADHIRKSGISQGYNIVSYRQEFPPVSQAKSFGNAALCMFAQVLPFQGSQVSTVRLLGSSKHLWVATTV